MSAHSELGGSVIGRRLKCPGSLRLSRGIPNESSIYAQEGTAAHSLGETCLLHKIPPKKKLGVFIANADGSSFEVTEGMAEAVGIYTDLVMSDFKKMSPYATLTIEKNFDLDWLAPDMKMFGTNDATIDQQFGVLKVWDYKHGIGVQVDAEDNNQLRYYALGALWNTETKRFKIREKIICAICQPRISEKYPVTQAEYDPEDLQAWGYDVLLPGAKKCMEPDASLASGDWCKFCPALKICPELAKRACATALIAFDDDHGLPPEADSISLPAPYELTPEYVSRVLKLAPLLVNWAAEVKSHALERMKQGIKYPRFKIVQGRKSRTWKDKEIAAVIMKKAYGDDAPYARKLLTVAQMEKMVKKEKGNFEDFETELVDIARPVALAEEKDKRPEYFPIAEAFNDEFSETQLNKEKIT